MEQALRSAIYYVHGNDESYLKYNVVTEVIFDGTIESLADATSHFRSDIRIRNLFGNKENICYEITDNLSRYYETLLLGQLDVILIVTRHDNAVKISKKYDKYNYNQYKLKTGIVKIDSVIAELNIINLSDSGSSNWYKYPIWALGMGIMGVVVNQIYRGGGPFDDFFKSD